MVSYSSHKITREKQCLSFLRIIIVLLLVLSITQTISTDCANNNATADSVWETSNTDFNIGIRNNVTLVETDFRMELRLTNNQTPSGWQKYDQSNKPCSRTLFGLAPIYGTDKVLLYGGYKVLDDTWVYDVSDNTWTQQKPLTDPGARYWHKLESVWGTDKVILYGARNGDETWIYDLSDNTWTDVTKSINPDERFWFDMASIYGTDKILLFGGTPDPNQYIYDDTWIFDLSDATWTELSVKNRPVKRSLHSMATVYGTDKVMMYGGDLDPGYTCNETWVFDLSENTWTNMTASNNKPCKLDQHNMASVWGTDKVVLYGGITFEGNWNNFTWMYDYSDNSWLNITHSNCPGDRISHELASIWGKDQVIFFGGQHNLIEFNDTWVYYPNKYKNGSYISTAFDSGTNSTFKTLYWDAEIPATTSIRFQLRSANTVSDLWTKDFIGPDGTSKSFYIHSPAKVWSGHNSARWMQYKVNFNTNDIYDTPCLKAVRIIFNGKPTCTVLNPKHGSILTDNTPLFEWEFIEPEMKPQAGFQVLIDDDPKFLSIDFDSTEQSSTEQHWQFPNGTSYTILQDGTWYWKVRTKESDGLWSEYTQVRKMIIDANPPTCRLIVPQKDSFYNHLNKISGAANDLVDGTGINKVEISIEQLTPNNFWDGFLWSPTKKWLVVKGTTNWEYNIKSIPWTSGGQYVIHLRATDNANNIKLLTNVSYFSIDMDLPYSIINFPIKNDFFNYIDIITGNSSDRGGSEIDRVEISITRHGDNRYWSGTHWANEEYWLPTVGTKIWSFNTSKVEWSTDTSYYIYSRAIDTAGNLELGGSMSSFMYDNRPPEHLSISINNGDIYTSSNKVTLSLTAMDSGSGVSEMAFRINNHEWSSWEKFVETKSITHPDVDGDQIIYFRVKDYAGNTATEIFDSIILDTTAPKNVSLRINNGAHRTNSTSVILDMSASDERSGVYQMSFSTDDNTWSDWEKFSVTKTYTLSSGDGKKTLFLKVKDLAGNAAEPVSAIIILNTSSEIIDTDDNKTGPGQLNGTSNQTIVQEKQMLSDLELGILIFMIIFFIIAFCLIFIIILKQKRKAQDSKEDQSILLEPKQVSQAQPQETNVEQSQEAVIK